MYLYVRICMYEYVTNKDENKKKMEKKYIKSTICRNVKRKWIVVFRRQFIIQLFY